MKGFKFTVLALALVTSLVACKQQNDSDPAQAEKIAPAVDSAVPADASTADPNAINEVIPADQFLVRLSQVGEPKASVDGASMDVVVKVDNSGTRPVYGVGKMPVNLGVQILGEGENADGAGGVREFVRVPLPYIAGGSNATVNVTVPFDPHIDGRKVRIALVQEGSRWYESSGYNPIDLGPFKSCGDRICDHAGMALKP